MLTPRKEVPEIQIDLVNDTHWSLKEQSPENFTMLIFYRGKHCPVCKTYLEDLQKMLSQFTDMGINIIAISSDKEDVAKATYEAWDIADIPVGFEFPVKEAREWGLYISEAIKDEEPDKFIEPGLFLIKPDQTLYSSSIQTMPFARPNFKDVLKGLKFVLKEAYPARGNA